VEPSALSGWDAVVHLAGKNLFTPWTAAAKRQIRESRVAGTLRIAEAIAAAESGPRVLIAASAVGFYGSRGDEPLDETSGGGEGFLAALCRDWESACEPARRAGVRVANLRFGIVLSRDGGALASMLPPFRLGLGGPLGNGRSWMSWVSREDAARAVVFVLESDIEGAVNVVAPEQVRGTDLARTLGRVLHRPAFLPVPAFALRLLPGGMADETFLASQRTSPARLTGRGFDFRDATLEAALSRMLSGDQN
jgi:uncharacterized protein (TIGR01777 family)